MMNKTDHIACAAVAVEREIDVAVRDIVAKAFEQVRRVPASEIEALVIKSVRDHLNPSEPIDDPSLVHTHVAREINAFNDLIATYCGE
jgi:hypothetical protein